MNRQKFDFTIFLIKDDVQSFDDCLKCPQELIKFSIDTQFELDGNVYVATSISNSPSWKKSLEIIVNDHINLSDNTSNKAILLTTIDKRILAITFGYGRHLLKMESVERNFGLKVVLNIIDSNKLKSINTFNIEDNFMSTQKQSSYSTDQDEFRLNNLSDILKGITGNPYDVCYGNNVSGKDSITASLSMEIFELKDKLKLYLDAYKSDRYKQIGFGWIDNINEVRDSVLIDELDNKLIDAIREKNFDNLHISPPEMINWEEVYGFCCTGMGLNKSDPNNYSLNIDLAKYINSINTECKICDKIKRDDLYVHTLNDVYLKACSIYDALIFQTTCGKCTYVLYEGNWYVIETSFFKEVHNYVKNIPISKIILPECKSDMDEKNYNIFIANKNKDFCLMDRKLISVKNGPKQIEACDIFTKDKKLIHIKNGNKSTQLSHLFSQGKVSAQCFISDEMFREQIANIVNEKFSEDVINYSTRPHPGEYEIVYAIIHDRYLTTNDLPFFSLVNLMITVQELDRMHYKYSVCFIKR